LSFLSNFCDLAIKFGYGVRRSLSLGLSTHLGCFLLATACNYEVVAEKITLLDSGLVLTDRPMRLRWTAFLGARGLCTLDNLRLSSIMFGIDNRAELAVYGCHI